MHDKENRKRDLVLRRALEAVRNGGFYALTESYSVRIVCTQLCASILNNRVDQVQATETVLRRNFSNESFYLLYYVLIVLEKVRLKVHTPGW